ncbi:MAG: hypothetical protein KTR28_04805 [Micavibrio sp.]|nr:hypothetical protein [Micavibrio sp.]
MIKRFLITSALIMLSIPASAQEREYQGGINTTRLAPQINQQTVINKNAKGLKTMEAARPDITTLRAQQYRKQQEEQAALEAAENAEDQEPQEDRIWNKYKKLATGTAKDDASDEAVKTSANGNPPAVPVPHVDPPNAPAKPSAETTSAEQKDPTLMQSLIQQYQQNKSQQKQMRSRTLPVPKLNNNSQLNQ